MATRILGISGLYHGAAAALVVDGEVVAAAQEERFTRRKNDPSLPVRSIEYCLRAGGVERDGIDLVAYYEKPVASFVRVLKTFGAIGIKGLPTFPRAMEESLRTKLWVSYDIEKALRKLGFDRPGDVVFAEHHVSHAAAAFYPSPFDHAAILTFDGVGEWATTSIGSGRGRRIDLLRELRFPSSIGLLYSAFTHAAGFSVNSGEYKLMGLAPFGEPTYRDRILGDLIDLRDDGSFTVDLTCFDYLAGRRMTNDRFDQLFDGPRRAPDAPVTRRECDLARSIQDVVEEVVLRVARHAHELTGASQAVLGGGVALNCVATGRLLREGPFEDVWVQPAAGDAGSALGCALWAWHEVAEGERPAPSTDGMSGGFLGPRPDDGAGTDVASALLAAGRPHERIADPVELARRVAGHLADGAVVGVCTGRLEFGPRALGHRSILADARDPAMHRRLNVATKHRETFRPFAPVVLERAVSDWFDHDRPSPYMSFVATVRGAEPAPAPGPGAPTDVEDLTARLAEVRSPIPAVTHVDGTARIQTVDPDRHADLHRLLVEFEALTGCPVLVNTSFNVRGEPIVASAEDAYRTFLATDIDWLVLDDCLLAKHEQAERAEVPAPAADA
ncbi:hypothetical protein KSP35_18445 [Aquihabitans sp. G128]|uniref:carbamoyltransferase family protein n=1 Tax=Aquihabitans sp. G128 TaxID=2849779 RepID=UPI001C21C481|nr:carbamoyltransferase N-terminal domain-containing protein [Aquihabitans sp. G128]QXC60295.1 hypothetical protein KSP35_18445 [Aquihabitans sp. G128]